MAIVNHSTDFPEYRECELAIASFASRLPSDDDATAGIAFELAGAGKRYGVELTITLAEVGRA